MFPRNLVARSGRSGESIVLLDERGCPTDESVVERFRPEDGAGSRMVAHFEAFKFYEDPVVRFQVTVQFCLERCQPVSSAKRMLSALRFGNVKGAEAARENNREKMYTSYLH